MSESSSAVNEAANKDKEFTIVVNAEEKTVHDKDVSFDDVTKLAYPTPPYANTLFTVSYRKAQEPKEGTLVEGQSVEVKKNGTIFNVKATDKS